MMPLFKKKLAAKPLASFLMDFTLTGNTDQHDSGRFALGPRGISTSDGAKVLPNGEKRSHWDHLSSRDILIIELETLYLRGFVVSILVQGYLKNNRARKAVVSEYEQIWKLWSTGEGLDYYDFYSKARILYGGEIFLLDLSAGGQGAYNRLLNQEVIKKIGVKFAELCDPYCVIVEPLHSELAETGSRIFTDACAIIANILETGLEKHKITV